MPDTIFIPVILGTARADRRSERVAKFIQQKMEETNVETTLVDVREELWGPETIAAWVSDERAERWRGLAKKADGYFIVTPEYNHGYPGELKMLLDAAYKEYKDKPVALCGVSTGAVGGARALEQLKPVLIEMMMKPLQPSVLVSRVKEAFDEDGNPHDEKLREVAERVRDELVADAHHYKGGREQ